MRRRGWPSSYGNRPKEKRGPAPAAAAGPLFSALKTSYSLFDGCGAGEDLERLAEGVLLLQGHGDNARGVFSRYLATPAQRFRCLNRAGPGAVGEASGAHDSVVETALL